MILIVGCPKKNKAPEMPSKPKGPPIGQINVSYDFSTVATDPDGNDIAYQFYWGGDTSDWSDFVSSGESITMSKSWSSANTYSIKARAEDKNGKISEWSEPHSILISAQTMWTKTFGGSGYDGGSSVQQTTDGGYIIAGWKSSNGNRDYYIIKTNSVGETLWTRTFSSGFAMFAQQTTDDGYIITGRALAPNMDLIKLNSNGTFLWGKGYEDASFNSVQQTSDDGFIICGVKYNNDGDIYLVKTDANGDTNWTKSFDFGNDDYGHTVQQTSDGGYIISAGTGSMQPAKVCLIKTDANGNEVWRRIFYGSDIWYVDWFSSVQQTTDGGYIITTTTQTFGAGEEDIYLIKTDTNGDTIWTKTFGGAGYDEGYSVQQTSDGGYIIVGTKSDGSYDDVYLIKTDASGNMVWTKTYGKSGWYDGGYCVKQTSDGGYIIVGETQSYGAGESDVLLIKTDANGNTILPSEKSGLSKSSSLKSHSLFRNRMGKFAEFINRK